MCTRCIQYSRRIRAQFHESKAAFFTSNPLMGKKGSSLSLWCHTYLLTAHLEPTTFGVALDTYLHTYGMNMPTNKPRIAMTLDHETYELISKFAELQGKSKSAVCSELLQGVTPFMKTPISILEKSKNAPESFRNQVLTMFEQLETDMLAAMEKSMQQDLFGPKH